jgi:two-component system, chemotaxis family, protein-glutamate methylesterase/glutaminase
MRPVRVLVVDDSAFARKVIRESLMRCQDIEVVGIARDGLEALEKIAEHQPDVVTLDLVMPNLDGLGVMRALASAGAGPRVVVVSVSDAGSELGVEALRLGAVELVHKPSARADDRLYEIGDELVSRVLTAAGARRVPVAYAPPVVPAPGMSRMRLIVIGASTGGPQAISRILASLPAELPVPVALVLHLPGEYTAAFARRLDELSPLEVVESDDRVALRPGRAVVARGGLHLKIEPGGGALRVRLDTNPTGMPHRPSVDVLFESAAEVLGGDVLGVILTGMGDDGLRGARRIRAAGGVVITEAESSCIVYGMPRTVREAGLSDAEAPIDHMAGLILSRL